MTIRRIIDKLKSMKPWHFLWITVVLAEIFTLPANVLQSYLWWGFISNDLLIIGAIDAFFVAAVVTPIAIYVLLPFYRRLNVTTAYQYLEKLVL